MIKKEATGLSFLVFEQLSQQKFLRHGVSLRRQQVRGQSETNSSVDFDLSLRDNPQGRENREWFCRAVGLPVEMVVRAGQVHGTEIGVVEKGGHSFGGTDGLCTRERKVGLMLLGADCPLIVVYDPVTMAVGVAHAGWRGTVGRISEKLITTMVEALGCDAGNMVAGIGPGISFPHYDVRADVMEKVRSQLSDAADVLYPSIEDGLAKKDRWQLDLSKANRLQLIRAGLRAENVAMSDYCTYRDQELFFSHRRDGKKAGRWGLLAGLTG